MTAGIHLTPYGVPYIDDDSELYAYPAYTRQLAEKLQEVGEPTAAVLALLADAQAAQAAAEAAQAAAEAAAAAAFTPVRAKGVLTAAHSLANNYTRVVGYTEKYDVGGVLDPATGFITIPTAGVYLLTGALLFATNSTGRRFLQIEKGTATPGTTNAVMIRQELANAASIYPGPSITLEDTFAAGDKLALVAYQTSGSALDARGDFAPTTFTVRRVA